MEKNMDVYHLCRECQENIVQRAGGVCDLCSGNDLVTLFNHKQITATAFRNGFHEPEGTPRPQLKYILRLLKNS